MVKNCTSRGGHPGPHSHRDGGGHMMPRPRSKGGLYKKNTDNAQARATQKEWKHRRDERQDEAGETKEST